MKIFQKIYIFSENLSIITASGGCPSRGKITHQNFNPNLRNYQKFQGLALLKFLSRPTKNGLPHIGWNLDRQILHNLLHKWIKNRKDDERNDNCNLSFKRRLDISTSYELIPWINSVYPLHLRIHTFFDTFN